MFFFHIITCFSQKKIEGVFIGNYGNGFTTKYTFNNNGVFQETNYQDLSTTNYGKGHYLIQKGNLIFNYDLTELKTQSYHKYNYYNSFNDSITVKITVLDMNEKPIYNIDVNNIYEFSDKGSSKPTKKTVPSFLNSRKKC